MRLNWSVFLSPLKVDLAIGLKAIRPESRPLLVKLNKIRNRFAHRATAVLEDIDQAEIKSSMSMSQKKLVGEYFNGVKCPRDALKLGTIAAFYEAKGAAQMLFTRKIEKEELLEEIGVLLEGMKCSDNDPSKNEFSQKVQRRVKDRLAKLEASPRKMNQSVGIEDIRQEDVIDGK